MVQATRPKAAHPTVMAIKAGRPSLPTIDSRPLIKRR